MKARKPFPQEQTIAAHPAKSTTRMGARLRIVDSVTGRPREQVLKKPLLMKGRKFITIEERAARLEQDHDDATVARRAGLSTAIVRRIRESHGISNPGLESCTGLGSGVGIFSYSGRLSYSIYAMPFCTIPNRAYILRLVDCGGNTLS
jgi:hypothetical protein